jgi:hypothetical protein
MCKKRYFIFEIAIDFKLIFIKIKKILQKIYFREKIFYALMKFGEKCFSFY